MMDQRRRSDVLQRDLRVLNQKEDSELQHKLNMLDRQYRYTRKMLQQRRDSLVKEQSRMVMVKVCEPKATVTIAMKEIDAETHCTDGRRLCSSMSRHKKGSDPVEQSRSVSAPPPSVQPAGSVRRRGNIRSSLSLMQMKNIATIDSISEKELARRQQRAREEMEKLRQFQRETLHKRVAAFIEKLKDKTPHEIHVEPP